MPLSIGDTLPSFTSDETVNYPGTINLDDYKGKLLILDFWSSYCSGCIAALPKLYAVQKKYSNRIAIIVVTSQSKLETETFWKKHNGTKDYLFPVITNDSILRQYFPYNSMPHIAWIDPAGIVNGITFSEYVTEQNIDLVLNNKQVNWPVKTIMEWFDPQQSLLTWNGNAGVDPSTIYYTTITGSLYATRPYWGIKKDSVKQTVRYTLVNMPISAFYSLALQQIGWQQVLQRIAYNVKDSSRLFPRKGKDYVTEWDIKNKYCYEAVYPLGITNEELGRQLIQDINEFSGLNGRIVKRKMDCWVLSKIRKKHGQKLSGSAPLTHTFNNAKNLIGDVSSVLSIRVLDEAESSKEFPIVMAQGDMQDIAKLNNRLELYGLKLKKKKRAMEVFIVYEK